MGHRLAEAVLQRREMDGLGTRGKLTPFKEPETYFGEVDPRVSAEAIAATADIALIVDSEGIIRDMAVRDSDQVPVSPQHWLNRPWVETVAEDSRSKVEQMVDREQATAEGSKPRDREVNHRTQSGSEIPVSYTVVPLGVEDHLLAVGRDLKPIAQLQQRLISAQQTMERDYARLRHAETRYRLLFNLASEAVLVVDSVSQTIIEANPSAGKLVGTSANRLMGQSLETLFESASWAEVQSSLASVRVAGQQEGLRAQIRESGAWVELSASLFRQQGGPLFLVRMVPVDRAVPQEDARDRQLLKVLESLPDAFVVIDPDHRILTSNTSFLDLVELATENQIRGEPLSQWLGRPGVDLNILMANLKEHGAVRNFATVVRGQYGASSEVEVSGVSAMNGEQPCFGFMIRPVTTRFNISGPSSPLPRSVEQLTNLVGRVPLKEIIRETTDVIESLCIEAALEVSGDNRASAAQLLGLSRQSLYAKLRRHGLGDLDPNDQGT
jgi:transcriptional regulator PpsR